MTRSWRAWVLFGLCLALGLGAMVWVTRTTLRMERAEGESRRRVALEANARQALWRMDYAFALFLAPEMGRPFQHYKAFFPAERSFTRSQVEIDRGEVLIPSPFLVVDDPLVRLRFQIDDAGGFTAPLVPESGQRALARRIGVGEDRLLEAEARLKECRALVSRTSILAAMAKAGKPPLTLEQVQELRSRRQRDFAAGSGLQSPFQVFPSAWVPLWQGGALFLCRQVWVGDREWLQGSWLDWRDVREVLLSTVRSTLPNAEVIAIPGNRHQGVGFEMTSLPVRLIPGTMPLGARQSSSAVQLGLAMGWGGFLLAGFMAAWLLHRTLQLSERRNAFVSAVTHELRTPLTTFRLYTEMLVLGMVPEDERPGYLSTLLEEADRLDHLVKNVLSYARLEATRRPEMETLSVEALLERPAPRFHQRVQQAGMALSMAIPERLKGASIRTEPTAVEQILFNLVDNDCKYSASGENRRVEIRVEGDGAWLGVAVRDHGPGIPEGEHQLVFEAFHKSAQRAAHQAPGVGLGLALCRQQARSLGGSLELNPHFRPGAEFVLRLPISLGKLPGSES